MNVRDLVVVITGGGAGIGLAAARAFASQHAKVLIKDADWVTGQVFAIDGGFTLV